VASPPRPGALIGRGICGRGEGDGYDRSTALGGRGSFGRGEGEGFDRHDPPASNDQTTAPESGSNRGGARGGVALPGCPGMAPTGAPSSLPGLGKGESGCGGAPARLSIVYFTGPHPDTLVSPLPTPLCGGPSRYPAVTAAEHVQMKISTAAVRGA
jgi:hypothetical protein